MVTQGDIERLEGCIVGSLNDEQIEMFDRLVDAGVAYRSYEGGTGFLGLAKIRFRRSIPQLEL